jgi:ATP:ADP antiporter, AAA family
VVCVAVDSLHHRAAPVGVALAVTTLAGVIADVVCMAQVLTLGGADVLLLIFPLSGIGLAIPALVITPMADRYPRLRMLRIVGLGTALAYVLVLALLPVAPMVAVSFGWIVAALQTYMYPMLLWSLAADLFNVTESRHVNGWIASWGYAGRLLALVIVALAPVLLVRGGLPLTSLLVLAPVLTAASAFWLTHRLRDAGASQGITETAGVRQAVRSGWEFVCTVRMWRWMVTGATISFVAATAISLGVSAASAAILGDNPASIQVLLAGTQLIATVTSLIVQRWWSKPLIAHIGIRGGLMVQPIAIVLAGVALALSCYWQSIALLAFAVLAWRVPEWTLDQTAKSAALGYVPDQRRARVSLILVLFSNALAWVLCAVVAAPGLLIGPLWLVGALPALVGLAALIWWVRLYRGWDRSLLDWQLKRRKRAASLDF